MLNGRITYIIVIIQAVFVENKEDPRKISIAFKATNPTQVSYDQSFDKTNKFKLLNIDKDVKCRKKYMIQENNVPFPRYNGRRQVRFIDLGSNDSLKGDQMEAPAAKFSILDLLSGEEDDDGQEAESGDYDDKVEDGKDEEEEGGNGINFFGDDDDEDEDEEDSEETDPNKVKDESEEGFLKQYHRHRLRMQNFVFPLLLAYKLKFFTVIPLLLGSLVLLVGTTGVAGFFFALFAAALGIHVKSQER